MWGMGRAKYVPGAWPWRDAEEVCGASEHGLAIRSVKFDPYRLGL